MQQNIDNPKWMDDPLVKDIPTRKLQFLRQIFSENHGKSQKDLMISILPKIKQAKDEGLTLTASEMNAAIAAIKKYSTADELSKIDNILKKKQSSL